MTCAGVWGLGFWEVPVFLFLAKEVDDIIGTVQRKTPRVLP